MSGAPVFRGRPHRPELHLLPAAAAAEAARPVASADPPGRTGPHRCGGRQAVEFGRRIGGGEAAVPAVVPEDAGELPVIHLERRGAGRLFHCE